MLRPVLQQTQSGPSSLKPSLLIAPAYVQW